MPQLGDSNKAQIYYHVARKKTGMTGNGESRISFYNSWDTVLTVFNLDKQSLANNKLLGKWVLKFCVVLCRISPDNLKDMTIQDAIDAAKLWLPFCTCLFLYNDWLR